MTPESYRTPAGAINRPAGRTVWAVAALLSSGILAAAALAQEPTDAPTGSPLLASMTAHLRAHPNASGAVTLVRHEHAYARTTTERGTLHVTPAAAHLSLDTAEIALTTTQVEAFDGAATPPRVLVQRGETVLSRYSALIEGDDPALLFAERVISRDGAHARVELLPRAAWLGLERVILRVVEDGAERGRIERALWLDGLGNWQRLDLEQLRHPAQLDPRALVLSPHPGARHVEL